MIGKMSNLMQAMIEAAMENCGRKPQVFRFKNDLKLITTYFFQMSGPRAYSRMAKNLPGIFPSVSTSKSTLSNFTETPVEGEIRLQQLSDYLDRNGYPKVVVSLEDATKIVERVQYNPTNNQAVGFVSKINNNGLPTVLSFPATSANLIKSYFEKNPSSSYAYVLMVQPLVNNSAPFIVSIFGTDNRFTAKDVARRWNRVESEAREKYKIRILGNCSDGDARLMKCMQMFTFSGNSPQAWEWFKAKLDVSFICVQDHYHIATKMRTRGFGPSTLIPMGNYCVSPSFLRELIRDKLSKDKHNLCEGDLNLADKMNFRGMEKMYQEDICCLLLQRDPASIATVTFLDIAKDVVTSFMDKTFSPQERIFKIWRWVFFLRIWRDWLQKSGFSLADNFITSNTFFCIEINAHALILLIILLRNSNEDHLFMTWLFSSQGCEAFFRLMRSLTTTQCTVVNFSMLELLYRVRRIEFQAEIEVKLGDKFCFPSSHRASRPSAQIPVLHKLPTDEEIEESIGKAKECALLRAKTLGMHYSSIPDISFNLRSFNIEIEDEFEGLVTVVDDLNIESESLSDNGPFDEENLLEREDQDFQEDICIISSGALGVKTFEQVSLSPDSAFVKVSDGFENPAIIKKSTLMRLLSGGDCKVSSDRIYRFKTPANTTKQVKPRDLESMLFQAEDIFEDDWCVFSTSDQKSFLIGKILSFGYLSGGSKKELRYSKRSAPVKASNSRDVGCLCSWYSLRGNALVPDFTFSQGFHSIAYYVCTIPRPSITEGKFYTTRIVEGEVKSLFKKKVSRKSK